MALFLCVTERERKIVNTLTIVLTISVGNERHIRRWQLSEKFS